MTNPPKKTPCSAALNIAGEHYPCDEPNGAGHDIPGSDGRPGLAHTNTAAQAIWRGSIEHVVSDTEACWCDPTVVNVAGK